MMTIKMFSVLLVLWTTLIIAALVEATWAAVLWVVCAAIVTLIVMDGD